MKDTQKIIQSMLITFYMMMMM